jgi:hypothetical protein
MSVWSAQVWNDDLVRAFMVRCREAGSRKVRNFHWKEAAGTVRACGKDIYEQNCKDGGTKIVNKPKGLTSNAANLLENIVRGTSPVVPPGMEKFGMDKYLGEKRKLLLLSLARARSLSFPQVC